MSNLEAILDKIKSDATNEKQKIIEDKKKQRQKLIEERKNEAEQRAERIINNAKDRADIILRNGKTQAKREKRDIELFAKNDVIDRVLKLTNEKLKDIDKDTYERFVQNSISTLEPTDGEILLQENMKGYDFDFGDFKISNDTVEEGFSVRKGDVMYDNRFSSLINYNRNEYEKLITEKLFS